MLVEIVNKVVIVITDPVLAPVRRILPPARIGGGAVDLSPLIVCVAVFIILGLL